MEGYVKFFLTCNSLDSFFFLFLFFFSPSLPFWLVVCIEKIKEGQNSSSRACEF